jgi:L-seryl-tRNA(Ser) seleniumtransferase
MASGKRTETTIEGLGVTPIIQAGGPNTKHSGSRPRPETLEAMAEASKLFVNMDELLLAAGKEIAELTGAEAATVTSGASGGLVVQAAAAIARDDPERIKRLPITDDIPHTLVIQKRHRFIYDHLYLAPGARFREVGDEKGCTPEQMEAAIDDQVVGIVYLESPNRKEGSVPLPIASEIAHRHGIPLLCDGASMLPPRVHLRKYLEEGSDLVSFSGGKAIRGPQSTGLLLGNREWVEYARLNNAPNATVARAQKVSKEEVLGLIAALKVFVSEDETAETARYRRMMNMVVDQVAEIPGVVAKVVHNYDHYIPHAVITFGPKWKGPDGMEIQRRLMAGSPRVYVAAGIYRGNGVVVDGLNIQNDEELQTVARRLREELIRASQEG